MEISQTPENALSHSVVKAVINAPIEKVNIADWLFNLPDAEYQKCSVNHIAAGQTASDIHNHEETPLFARSIEKKALTGTYGI